MAPTRFPGAVGTATTPTIDAGTLTRTTSPAPGTHGVGPTHPDQPDIETRQLRELGLDLL